MNEASAKSPLCPWQRGVWVYDYPLFSQSFIFFLILAIVGVGLSIARSFVGLSFTGMSDAYAWGIWKTFNVMTLTALGSGGFAVGIAAWVFNWKSLHLVMRTALLTSLVFYFAGMVALTVDVGRPWNLWHVLVPSHWNTDSALLEVAICMPLYAFIFLTFENLPPLLERIYVHASDSVRQALNIVFPTLKRVYPFVVAGAYLLPIMHQSSLGALLLLAGDKIHPLWQTQLLPLLYVVQAGVCGVACVTFTLMVACLAWRRPMDPDILGDLARLMGRLSVGFVAIRFADVVWRGHLGTAFSFDPMSLLFHLENLLVLIPSVVMLRSGRRQRPRTLFMGTIAVAVGGMLYRFTPTTVSYQPGELHIYFPSFVEILISLGYIAMTIVIYNFIVKNSAILPAPLDDWYTSVAWARKRFRSMRMDEHGKAISD
ncbi:MAG: NrfD/PsrC family molybdoenzyme membrane anchor subunit [Myxococcota bacterium]